MRETPVKYKRITLTVPSHPFVSTTSIKPDDKTTAATSPSDNISVEEDTIIVTALYDNANNVTGIKLVDVKEVIPRTLIQVIGYLSLYYDQFNRIHINRCKISSYIVHELSKLVYTAYITDINLDGSPVKEGNYYILLDHAQTQIKYLSLSRCKINDEVCKEIAIRLHYARPAGQTLLLLNFTSNHITDEGAKHLGEALKTNRRLRYLNLSDNRIGDDGANCILSALSEFALTSDENMIRKKRLFEYLRNKNEMIAKYLSECETKSCDEISLFSRRSSKKNKKISAATSTTFKSRQSLKRRDKILNEDYLEKAKTFAIEMLGPLRDPFEPNSIKVKDDVCYSGGNMVLSYLNVAFNQMGYLTVKKILAVLQYQRVARKLPLCGLMKVVIEGNPMPMSCVEYQNINDLGRLCRSLFNFGGRSSDASYRKKRSTRISVINPGMR